ncbi:MAG: bifunctional riboflavin kinase/FAD synthetase [Candidatus Omnitrophica bacterium]|nr:bifunctional riboflavin kinase/FAD synthetase [Candidatus Omnitrophota bacterium]
MKIYNGFSDPRLKRRSRSVAIGIFDGVHRGHEKILRKLGPSGFVVTFEPHPNKVLRPRVKHPILMSLEHRLRLFEKLPIAEALVIRFDKRFSRITREDFVKKFLLDRVGMRSLVVGHDFRFGAGGRGNIPYLKSAAKKYGFQLQVVGPLKHQGEVISSTRIRNLIERGALARASTMLGRPVSVYGTVVRGKGRGRSMGYPTANLNPHHETLPPDGVYAAWGDLNGRKLKGVIHIGRRPTFGEKEPSLEVHFLNFKGNLYGKEIELIFVKRLRSIRRFHGAEALSAAIHEDIARARKLL